MTDDIVVVGIGMVTAVGVSAPETAASVRAATSRFVESSLWDRRSEPFILAEVPEEALPEVSEDVMSTAVIRGRERRMLRLATAALRECLAPLGDRPLRPGLCLALPEMETTRRVDRTAFLANLAKQTKQAFDPRGSDATHTGRAGGLLAIGQGVLTIQAGLADFVIAGGVDSYRDPYVLAILDKEQRVKSSVNLDGFIPGEGAAFLLLARRGAAAGHGLTTLGCVTPVATGFETGHLYSAEPYRGDGLATTFQQLVARGVVDAPIGDVYSSMTGESHWAKEWGVAFLRTKAAFHEGHGVHHPADCFGETGAASGPLLVGLALMGINGRYRRSPVLAYGSSDRGARAAVVVTA
jgi:3-oxoacyl-[acyl-carrier-protein] synthase-1